MPFGRPAGFPDCPFAHGRRFATPPLERATVPPLFPVAASSRRCAADLRVPLMLTG
jgi:hypothetical protein